MPASLNGCAKLDYIDLNSWGQGMKATASILIACFMSTVTYAADGYPVEGAWALVTQNAAATSAQAACNAVSKFGVRNLSGKSVGEIVVFSGKKRSDFGGYADTVSTNITVEAKSDGQFKIVDQYYDDGEGGVRPGLKRKAYFLKLIDAATLVLSDGKYDTRYVKCASDKASPTSGNNIEAVQRSEPAATLIELWYDANSRCRGGSGSSPLTEAACSERERYSSRLDALGRCYGKRGQIGAEMKWHFCSPDSIRDPH